MTYWKICYIIYVELEKQAELKEEDTMTRLIDKSCRSATIEMKTWDSDTCQYSADWEDEFFDVATLPYIDEDEAYLIDDIEYAIEVAMDWKYGRGDLVDDFEGQNGHMPEHRTVIVNGEYMED